ncbi:FG-GAP-like repeat-containing protein [Marivirga tractuosa]|uniref:FG-GAP-like repeat-containing protein n=1 Tax=Marivirga tractuosa TaxID=1006 RepID=UPI0035CF9187
MMRPKFLFLILFLFTSEILFSQSFTEHNTFGVPALGNSQSEWLDFNYDGFPDLIVDGATENGNRIFSLYRNNGDNTFSSEGLPVSALEKSHFLLMDVNSDNFTDIIYTGENSSAVPETKVLLGSATGFVETAYNLPAMHSAQLAAVDFDQNGHSDILMMGVNSSGNIESSLWLNDGNDFYESGITLPQVYRGTWAVLEVNEDLYHDILISGEKADGFFTTKIYLNQDGEDIVNQANSALDDYLIQEMVTADVTENGKLDLIISGRNNSFSPFVKIYENSSGQFSEFSAGLSTLSSSSIEVIDVENDGDLDILLFGLDNSSDFQGLLYTWNGINFTEDNSVVDGISNGAVSVIDFDQNGNQDIFYSGFSDINPSSVVISRLLLNQTVNVNNPPSIPDGLSHISKNDSVQLNWDQATDDLTNAGSISYNLYVGSSSGDTDIHSPLADLTSGGLYTHNIKPVQQNSFHLKNLEEGVYFWSVQSKDAGGKTSGFSPEQSFTICFDPDLGKDTAICRNEEIAFSIGTVNDEVNWYSLKDGLLFSDQNDLTWEVLATDTIVVEVIKTLGCTVYDTLAIEMLELPVSPLPESESICDGQLLSYNLNMPDHTINWYSVNQGLILEDSESIDFEVIANDTLVAEFINANNCTILDSVIIQKLDLPPAVELTDTTICKGEELEWNVAGTYNSIKWVSSLNGQVAEDVNTFTDSYTEIDTLFITKTNADLCSITDTVVININPLPVVDLGSDLEICDQSSTTIELPGDWSSVQWTSDAEGVLSENSQTLEWLVTQNDILCVEATNLSGCTNYDTLEITKLELPNFDIGNDTIICKSSNILLNTGTGFASVNWYSISDGLLEEGSRFFDYQVQKTDTIIAEVFSFNGCVDYDSILIVANEPMQYSLGDDLEICKGEEVNLSVQNLQDSINWYFEDSLIDNHSDNIAFLADSSLTVSIETIDSLGCSAYDTLALTVNELPLLDLPESIEVCTGEEVVITNSQTYDYIKWESTLKGLIAEDVNEISYVATSADTLFLTARDEKLCVNYDTLYINPNKLPEFSLGDDLQVCDGDNLRLEIDKPADSINWFNNLGEQLLDTTAILNLEVKQNVTWWAEQWNATSCVFRDSVEITHIPLPVFNAGDSILICEEAEVQLNPEGINENWTLEWSSADLLSDASIANPIAKPEEDTWFFLQVQNAEGCSYTDSVFVALDQPLILDPGEDRIICLDDFTELGGTPTADGSNFPYQYEWSPSESLDDPNVANPMANPSETTTYQVISWAGNCKADTAEVTVRVQLPPDITLSADTTIGSGDAIQLLASGGQFYQWKPERGLSDATIANPIANPVRTTTYTVEVLDSLGCLAEKEMTVFVENQLFIPNLFTPNNDGQNDFFKIYGAGIKEIEFKVFTRGGKLLYSTNSVEEAYGEGWDGNHNGNPIESGVYVWSIKGKYFDERPLSFNGQQSGVINLMR